MRKKCQIIQAIQKRINYVSFIKRVYKFENMRYNIHMLMKKEVTNEV